MKRWLAWLTAAALAVSCAGCGGDAPSSAAEKSAGDEEPLTLTVVTSYGGDDGNRAHFEAAVAAFEASTGVTVRDDSATSNEGWKVKVLTDFETGSEPDVLFFFTNADADPLTNAGRVVSIEEIRQEYPDYASNMKSSMLAEAADGRHYAVPGSGYWENLFVNEKVLEACGVAMPGPDYTWEQFLDDCGQIKAHGYTPIACSLCEVPHYWFEFCVMNNGSLADHLDVPRVDENGQLIMDGTAKKWIAALEDIRLLYQRGYFPANTLTATDAEAVGMFGDGEAAFLIDGSWQVGYFAEHHAGDLADYAVAYVPAKGERKATEAIGGISMGYFITRKAWKDERKRDAAVRFVSLMTSDEVLSTFVKTEVTALVNGARPEGLNILEQSAAEVNAHLTGVTGAVQDRITPEAKSELFADIREVVAGRMTAEEAVCAAVGRERR